MDEVSNKLYMGRCKIPSVYVVIVAKKRLFCPCSEPTRRLSSGCKDTRTGRVILSIRGSRHTKEDRKNNGDGFNASFQSTCNVLSLDRRFFFLSFFFVAKTHLAANPAEDPRSIAKNPCADRRYASHLAIPAGSIKQCPRPAAGEITGGIAGFPTASDMPICWWY